MMSESSGFQPPKPPIRIQMILDGTTTLQRLETFCEAAYAVGCDDTSIVGTSRNSAGRITGIYVEVQERERLERD